MKFVLVNTGYRADTLTVDERYLRRYDEDEIARADWFEDLTLKLSLAKIWNSRESVEWYMHKNERTDLKIVSITEEKLFTARLADK